MPTAVRRQTDLPAPPQSEAAIQAELVRWARTEPGLELLLHIPNGGERGGRSGGVMVALGARKGVPDLFLPRPVGAWAGLWLELKTDRGELAPAQIRWLHDLRFNGYAAVVAHGLQAAQDALRAYLAGADVHAMTPPLPPRPVAASGPRQDAA